MYELENDSIVLKKSILEYDSLFFININNLLEIDSEDIFKLDTILKNGFLYNVGKDKMICINMLSNNFSKLKKNYENKLRPYIAVTCEMATQKYERSDDGSYSNNRSITKGLLIDYYNQFKIADTKPYKEIHDFFKMNALGNGSWKFYGDLVKYLKTRIDSPYLKKIYVGAMRQIESEIKNNFKVNTLFASANKKFDLVIDTLGQHFTEVKSNELKLFIDGLPKEKIDFLNNLKQSYDKTINLYLEATLQENYIRSYGFQEARAKYYSKVAALELKHPNFRLFKQNFQDKIPNDFNEILMTFNNFMTEEKYQRIAAAEKALWKSMEPFNQHAMTPFNPYFGMEESQRRDMRLKNWLLSQAN